VENSNFLIEFANIAVHMTARKSWKLNKIERLTRVAFGLPFYFSFKV
jgi:hypothetical protein